MSGRPSPPQPESAGQRASGSEPDTVPIPRPVIGPGRGGAARPPAGPAPGRWTPNRPPAQQQPRIQQPRVQQPPPAQPWYLAQRRRPTPPIPPRAAPPIPPRPAAPQSGQPPRPAPAPIPPRPVPAPIPPRPAAQRPPHAHGHRGRRLLLAVGLAVLLVPAVLVILVLAKLGRSAFAGTTELDIVQAQLGVQQVLTDPINGYGRADVTDVHCNDGVNPTVKAGASFTCRLNVDGAARQVLVVFADDTGTYEVDRPR